jgi:hypothetical protein
VVYCLYLQNIRLRAAVVVTGLDTLGWHRMDNYGLGLQSGVPTLSQYFGTFNLITWTVIFFNVFRDWTELATLGEHRLDNFGLGLQPWVTTLGTARMGGT